MSWQEAIGGLMVLLGTGAALIIIAELLCGMVDLQRREPEAEAAESVADAEFRRLSEEIEAAKRREVRR